jgi:hypothetical protein
MNEEEYTDWIKSLKSGDVVRVSTYPGCFSSNFKVKNITKSGKIRLDSGELFRADGDKNITRGYGFKRICPVDSKCF